MRPACKSPIIDSDCFANTPSTNMKRGIVAESLILGRYKRIETLGEGGSGTVELCWDTRIMRRVAIKRMPIQETGRNGHIPGLAEARTGAMLNHPSIVSVYDFETADDEAFLIMEAIEGPSLTQVIDATPPGTFDLDIVACIATAVANALDYAHENQVLHLDVKPDNILITRNGTTKVSDFGISELAGAQGFGQASGGTIGYMPPEQFGDERLDERCDEFAFAMAIYEMLTGENPYFAKTLSAGLKALGREQLVAPSALRDDIDPMLDDILLTALSYDRTQRYPSVYDFFDELLPYLGDARAGIAKLRDIVNFDDELEEDDEPHAANNLLSRFDARARQRAGRVGTALLSWGLATVGLTCLPDISAYLACAIALLAALGALVKPAFGAFVSLVMFGACLVISPQHCMPAGVALIAWCVIWYLALGRELLVRASAAADFNCALSIVPLGLLSFTPLAPLLTGLCLPVKRALLASVTTALLALSLAALTATGSLFGYAPLEEPIADAAPLFVQMVTVPSTWIILFGWILSTIVVSAAHARATRVSSAFGAVAGSVVLLATRMFATWTVTGAWALPDPFWLLACALAATLTIIGSIAGCFAHDKGED